MIRKKRFCFFLLFVLLLMVPVRLFAEDDSQSYRFTLESAEGDKKEIRANTGDILEVTFIVRRTDTDEESKVAALQNEIFYDSEFFTVLPEQSELIEGAACRDIETIGGVHLFYINYLAGEEISSWEKETTVGTFRVRVDGENGASILRSQNVLVSTPDASDSYEVETENLKVIVSDTCTVRFDAGNRTGIVETSVKMGHKVKRPGDPTWRGHRFRGWYSDQELTEEWDFDEDVVEENMTLYGAWVEDDSMQGRTTGINGYTGEEEISYRAFLIGFAIAAMLFAIWLITYLRRPVVTYDSQGGTEVPSVQIYYGRHISPPLSPTKTGVVFGGWYTRPDGGGHRWNFDEYKVRENITLYAYWL